MLALPKLARSLASRTVLVYGMTLRICYGRIHTKSRRGGVVGVPHPPVLSVRVFVLWKGGPTEPAPLYNLVGRL